MRVALIDPSLFTLPYDAALARGLASAGCEVTVHGRAVRPADGVAGGVDMAEHFYPLAEHRMARALPKRLRLALKGIDHALSMARLWRLLKRARPQVIHFQWLPLPLLDGALLGRFRRLAPLVLTVHDTDPFNGSPAARLQRLGIRQAISRFDRLIVHTEQGRARLIAQGASALHTSVLPHGSLSTAKAAKADPMQGMVTLLLFGKIKAYKGADILIDAFARIPAALRADCRVRIIGQPYMDLAGLHERIRAHGLAASVAIETGFVAEDMIDILFGAGTIAVFPYREIEASGVLSYAVANGRPIVASRLGSFAENLRDQVHGRLVPPGDVAALAEALAGLLADRDAASACAANVAGLGAFMPQWDDIARQTVRVYTDAMQEDSIA